MLDMLCLAPWLVYGGCLYPILANMSCQHRDLLSLLAVQCTRKCAHVRALSLYNIHSQQHCSAWCVSS